MAALDAPPSPAAPVATGFAPDLMSYEIALVAFSGGKDSLGLVLRLLDLGFPRERIELHHHLVDCPQQLSLLMTSLKINDLGAPHWLFARS